MTNHFCRNCGASVETGQHFCRNCGQPVGAAHVHHRDYRRQQMQQEPREKLFCELAYCGVLFFLPLLFCQGVPKRKTYANHGLWLLILSVMTCNLMNGTQALKLYFAGHLMGLAMSFLHTIVMMGGILFLLYQAICALRNALAIHRDEDVEPILFFDEIPIMKDEKHINY